MKISPLRRSIFVPCILCTSFLFAQAVSPDAILATSTSLTEATTSGTTSVSVGSTTVSTTTSTTIVATSSSSVSVPQTGEVTSNLNVESRVRAFFSDIPVMIAIAKCESRFRQFNISGGILDGGSGGMVGIFQINRPVHELFAKARGFNIETIDGNMGYARYLYQKEGTNPWMDSFPCWSTTISNPESVTTQATPQAIAVTTSTTEKPLTANLSFGMIHQEVLMLQKILNGSGFVITASGPGSLGNETNKFGSLTRDAIRRFQCARGIVCAGDEGSTGYGYVGARTRAALLSASPLPSTSSGSASISQQAPQPSTQIAQSTIAEEKATKIASLQAQIDKYLKVIQDIQKEIESLKGR